MTSSGEQQLPNLSTEVDSGSVKVIVYPILPLSHLWRHWHPKWATAAAMSTVCVYIMVAMTLWRNLTANMGALLGQSQAYPTYVILMLSAMTGFGSCCVAAIGLDNRICLDERGLTVPLFLSFGARFRRALLWRDLRSVRMVGRKQHALRLKFRFGHTIELDLRRLNRPDMEKLVEALDAWVSECEEKPDAAEILQVHLNVTGKSQAIQEVTETKSYTRLWNESLESYSFTPFSPHEPGVLLQDGRYTIEKYISGGGFSAVYLAGAASNRKVVVKQMVIPAGIDEQHQEKTRGAFLRECSILQQLEHPQIVRVIDQFVESGGLYLVLERVEGQDLRSLVKLGGKRSLSEVLQWAEQLSNILMYMHGLDPQVVHRDLAPDNVVLGPNGTLTLIDFGAANEIAGQCTGTLIGKQAYMAPEQVRGHACAQSDIYGLGATMFFLLTATDPPAICELHIRNVLPAIDADVDQLIAECTRINLDERIASAQELKARIDSMRRSAVR